MPVLPDAAAKEGADFSGRLLAILPDLKVADFYGADPRSHQLQNFAADSFDHAPDLPVPAFRNCELYE